MHLVIETQSVKRELNGPFNICAKREDLETLQKQIAMILENWESRRVDYGWATIWPEPIQATDNAVRPWADK